MSVDAENETSATPSSPAKCHDILWFPDGNIVLATNTYFFRVHKSVLALQSSVFRDMYALPTTEDLDAHAGTDEVVGMTPELYEGLPMVSLVDEGKDVEHLLKAIYVPRYVTLFLTQA